MLKATQVGKGFRNPTDFPVASGERTKHNYFFIGRW